jgi:pimeloyl-ACP methyl ester carboxylesterase
MKKLVLLHGALGAASQLQPLKKILENQFEIFILEFEGHGLTKSDALFSIDLFVSNLKSFLDYNNLKNVVVFGYSMGGYVALKLASKHPEYFEKIITLGTKFDWTPESAEREIKMLNPEKIEEKVPAFAKMLDRLHSENGWKNVMRKTADMMQRLGNGEATMDEVYQNIKTKCFIGVGDGDQMVTQDETKRVASLIKNAEFYLLENTVHPIDKVDLTKLAGLIKEKVV